MRLEADAGPVLEWDEQLEGQRCDYLVGEGVWLGGVIVSQRPGRSSYSIRLANGLVVQRGLPDHRVVLHAEQDACLETVLDSGPADAKKYQLAKQARGDFVGPFEASVYSYSY